MLAKCKLNSIETLISQALIDFEVSHEELKIIVNEKKVWKNEMMNQMMNRIDEKNHESNEEEGKKKVKQQKYVWK